MRQFKCIEDLVITPETMDEVPKLDPIPDGESGGLKVYTKDLPAGKELSIGGDRRASFSEDRNINIITMNESDKPWMSVTAVEVSSMNEAAKHAKGRVLVGGLGLGVFPRLADKAEEIIIVENDRDVINLVWPHIKKAVQRAAIIHGDLHEVVYEMEENGEEFDTIYIDIFESGSVDDLGLINWHFKQAENILKKDPILMAWLYEHRVRKCVEDCESLAQLLKTRRHEFTTEKVEGMKVMWPPSGKFAEWYLKLKKRPTPKRMKEKAEEIGRSILTSPKQHKEAESERALMALRSAM